MGEYKPPFTITNEILFYVASISEKTEQQIAELEERLRTIRAAQKKEEDSEIIRAIRSTKMGGRELLALLDNIQAGNVTFLTAVNNASEEAETEEAIEKDA